jgi:hypothetical protein
VPLFGAKDRNEQQETASKKYLHLKIAIADIYTFIYQQFAQL